MLLGIWEVQTQLELWLLEAAYRMVVDLAIVYCSRLAYVSRLLQIGIVSELGFCFDCQALSFIVSFVFENQLSASFQSCSLGLSLRIKVKMSLLQSGFTLKFKSSRRRGHFQRRYYALKFLSDVELSLLA